MLGKRTVFVAALLVVLGIGIGAGWFLRPVSGPGVMTPADPAATPAAAAPTVADRSIAVLPFVNMSADPEQGYFSDGMTEEIINALVKIDDLLVTARTSVFAFKGHSEDVREIGRRLGVTHVLEGSVRTQGEQVRITVQLIDGKTGFHHWSETFDRGLADVSAIQDQIANAIAGRMSGRDGARIDAVPQRTTWEISNVIELRRNPRDRVAGLPWKTKPRSDVVSALLC